MNIVKGLEDWMLRVEGAMEKLQSVVNQRNQHIQYLIEGLKGAEDIERNKIVTRVEADLSSVKEQFEHYKEVVLVGLDALNNRIATSFKETQEYEELHREINELKKDLQMQRSRTVTDGLDEYHPEKEENRLRKRKKELSREFEATEKQFDAAFNTQLVGFSVFVVFYGVMQQQGLSCNNIWFSISLLVLSILGNIPFYWMMGSKMSQLSKRVERITVRNDKLKEDVKSFENKNERFINGTGANAQELVYSGTSLADNCDGDDSGNDRDSMILPFIPKSVHISGGDTVEGLSSSPNDGVADEEESDLQTSFNSLMDEGLSTGDIKWRYLMPTIGLCVFSVVYAVVLAVMVFYSCGK